MHTLEQLRSGALAGITRLSLRAGLTTFPPEIYSLADSLEILDLSDNQLCTLPDDLPRLHKLRVIFCSNNPFTTLPAVLGRCRTHDDRFQILPHRAGARGGITCRPALVDTHRQLP